MDLETIAKGTLPSLPPHLPQKPLPNLPQVNARHFASKPNSQNSYPELHQDLEERDSVKTSYSSLGRQKTANGRNMESTAEYEKRMSDLLSELDVEDDGVQVKYNNIPTNTPSKSLYRKSDAYNLLPKMSVSSLHFFGEEDEDEEEQIADYKKLKKSKSNSSISSLNTIIKNTEKTGSNHSLDTSHGVLKKSPSSTKSLNSINESSSISALSRTKTTKFSLKHEVALKDSNIFQDATNQILRNLSLRKESPMLVSTLKTFGICTTLIFTEEGICHRVEISPKITINEILMEILSYYGEIDSFGQMDFKMHLVEGLKETAIDTNYPICYFQKDVDSPPVFQLKYKPTKWVISIELPAERSRKLIVGKDTTVQYVIDLMNVIEDCSESGYGLFCEIGDERKFLESHLKPFNFPITGSFSFISASDGAKRRMKRSTILGEKDLDLLDDEKDEIELKAEEDLKRKKEALKSQKLANMLGLEHEVQPVIKAKPKSNAFEKIKSARNSGIGMVANTLGVRAKGFYRSQDELVSSSTDFSTESSTSIQSTQSKSYVSLKSHHVVQEKTEFTDDDDDDITMDPVNRKASKMLDFFGVKAGQKEVGVISNLSRKNDKKQIKREVNNGTFLVRIYFGNLTFTAISLNLNAGPAEAISLIFKKFNIKDRQELYVITEYQQSTGFESKLEKGDRLYERMNTWEKNEIFIFKRSVETKKLRAAQEQQIEEVQKDSNKRVAKLSNFFGIDEKSSGAKNGSRKELLELNKLLKEMNNLESISLDFNSKRSNANRHINKEGWVEKEDKKAWKTCFFSMNNGVIVLRFAASRNDALSGDDKNVITLRLDQCNLEGTPIKSNGKYIFYIHDHVYERHGFGLETLKEADDWIDSIGKAISVSEQISKNSINNSHTSISQNEDTIHQDTELNLSDFTIHRVLGRGKFAKVVLCSQKDTGNVYAMKIIQKELDEEKCLAEARILKMVKHPFIVNLICAFQNAENVYMVMEYVSGGEIFFHISNFGRFNEDRVRYYCAEITLALEHLYSKRIIYRDIKLENLLLGKDGHIKLSDFGLSKKSLEKEAKSTTIVGTLEYLSPELLLGKLVTFSVDHWAFGVVTFEMLCGYHPFYSEDRLLIHDYILNAPIEFPDHLSLDSKDFVSSLLNRDPNKRMTMGHDKENMARNHKFFQNVNWNGILAKEIPAPFLPEITDDFDVSFFDETFTQEVITAADKLGSATSINIGGKHTSIFKGK